MLKINNLSCQKGYNLLFSQLSFTVNLGGILRITGTNGCGKTSLLKIIAGLNIQEQGTIFLDNDAVKSEDYQRAIFYLGHLSALSAELTCLENLKFLTALNQSVAQPGNSDIEMIKNNRGLSMLDRLRMAEFKSRISVCR
jgi:heme exporter protein A